MKDSLEFPPLFVRAMSPEGELFSRVLRKDSFIEEHFSPGSRVEVIAPSGSSARFTVGDDDEAIRYQDLHAKLLADPRCSLWQRAYPRRDVDLPEEGEEIGFCPFAGNAALADAARFEPLPIDGMSGVRLGFDHSSILAWSRNGPATVSLSRSQAVVLHATNLAGRARKIRTIVLPENAAFAAYWMFDRNGCPEASEQLGLTLAEQVSNGPGDFCEEAWYILADFLLKFGTEDIDPELINHVFDILSQIKSPDSNILIFCLSYYGLVQRKSITNFSLFRSAVIDLSEKQCEYTSVFRLFLGVFDAASNEFAREISADDDVRIALPKVLKLGACAYWDGVLLAYRASEPGAPDPEACGRDVSVAAKKKSAAGRSYRPAGFQGSWRSSSR